MSSIAVYARVSTDQQAQQATIESQLAALRQRAKEDGHIVSPDDVYVDEGFSGSTLRRPALERLRDRIAEGAVHALYVHSPDRLARRYAYQVLLLDEFARHQVQVVFLNGRTNESAEDQLLVQVQGVIAEYERAKILERSRRGKLHKARAGVVSVMAGAPFGYQYVHKSEAGPASYKVLLHEAKIVRKMFEWIVYEQKSMHQVCKLLDAQGVPTRRRKGSWQVCTVRGMLSNSTYMGKAAYGKGEAAEPNPERRPRRNAPIPRTAKSSTRRTERKDWIYIDVPALISAELFAAAQEQLERNRQLSPRNATLGRYLLKGLIVCARCGYAYHARSAWKGEKRGLHLYSYYRCSGCDAQRFGGKAVCQNRPVRLDQLEQHVWRSVCELLEDPSRVQHEWSRRGAQAGQSGFDAHRTDLDRTIAAHERALQRLVDAYEAGILNMADIKSRSRAIKLRIERARAELQTIDRAARESTELTEVIARLEDFARRVHSNLDKLSWEDRKQLIRTLVSKIEVDLNDVTIVYRIGTPTPASSRGTNLPSTNPTPNPAAAGVQSCQLRMGLPQSIRRRGRIRASSH